jgi:DNA-binding CsgD family transcriptional regulator
MASAIAPIPEPDSYGRVGAEELLRSLLARLEEGDKPLLGQNSEEILLDIDVDGARYLVLRMPKAIPQRAQLSPREQEIVRMVAQGHPNKVIADCLGISLWTVGTYVRRIFAKTGVGSRAAMVARVLEECRPERKAAMRQKRELSDPG